MKDLRFTGYRRSNYYNETFKVDITFRVDMINGTDNNQNLQVLEIRLDRNTERSRNEHEEVFGAGFRKLPYNLGAFKDFATSEFLDLTMADSTGDNLVTLVDTQQSGSASSSS